MALGDVLILLGLLVWSHMAPWLGHLPGDIRVVRPNTRIYIPVTTMVILSIALSVLLAIARAFV